MWVSVGVCGVCSRCAGSVWCGVYVCVTHARCGLCVCVWHECGEGCVCVCDVCLYHWSIYRLQSRASVTNINKSRSLNHVTCLDESRRTSQRHQSKTCTGASRGCFNQRHLCVA